MESGGEIIFTQDYITIDVYGRLEIKGTQSNPVKIKTIKSNFAIITHPGSEVIIDNVEIEKGGYQSFLMNNFFSSAIAANYMGAVHFEGGNVNIKGTTFKNCSNAVTSEEGVAGELKVNYSKFINNEYDVEDENDNGKGSAKCGMGLGLDWTAGANSIRAIRGIRRVALLLSVALI